MKKSLLVVPLAIIVLAVSAYYWSVTHPSPQAVNARTQAEQDHRASERVRAATAQASRQYQARHHALYGW